MLLLEVRPDDRAGSCHGMWINDGNYSYGFVITTRHHTNHYHIDIVAVKPTIMISEIVAIMDTDPSKVR